MYEFYKERKINEARKRHRCSWCAEFIEVGESYHTVTGKWDGDFSYAKMHPECFDAYERDDDLEEYYFYAFKRGKTSSESESGD